MWQYEFPESFIKIQAVWHQWVDYSIEGIARSLEKLCLIPYHDDYTTIWQRVHDMKPEIKLPTYEIEAGLDESFTDICISHKRNF